MKLLYCPVCADVVRLIAEEWRACDCGESGGQYNTDGMTATLGGLSRVFGVSNTFFNELWLVLNDEQKAAYREKNHYGPGDCWWGEFQGDTQIFRIAEASGPRLEVFVEKIDIRTNKVIVIDKREFTIDGKKQEFVVVPANPVPSFKGRKK